ncbi:dual adapter for phosphotyrosine and 3-phosphotyrosine and 3-phosphoinositide [Anaeramoeba flamelloides]|uniref:Dual adapter for phosphotyrosine and 3-phosphotyrosine and 3-phosphoinositide n=1 Tax=Anaeramoeba flamelloides TaxID=1746091 RepID=A0ABQ8Y8C9_9EUKA|nr:dual adapter for phosphotyrosine and 3-phosphotyrosine and 3-phosphoinositide [Anaeramoeba flamelloides]
MNNKKLYRALFNHKTIIKGDLVRITDERQGSIMCYGSVKYSQKIIKFPRAFVLDVEMFNPQTVNVEFEGVLKKKPKYQSSFKTRYIKLYNSRMFWFHDDQSTDPLSGILLSNCKKVTINKNKISFQLKTKDKTWNFVCKDSSQTKKLVSLINSLKYSQDDFEIISPKNETFTRMRSKTGINIKKQSTFHHSSFDIPKKTNKN